jgi:hypothetical protein
MQWPNEKGQNTTNNLQIFIEDRATQTPLKPFIFIFSYDWDGVMTTCSH